MVNLIHQITLLFCIGCTLASDSPIVTTPLGQYRGSILTSRLGKEIFSFRGISYAQPPINELRFKPPVPINKHEGVFDATKDGPVCPQPSNDPISEDCLKLNVYTTKLSQGRDHPKRPVIIYIHAGGYYSVTGRSNWAGPQYLLDQDVVLVTFNYRLGSLGFLSTGDKDAPGNNGLKDQVMAFKWVKENIEPFGGDPKSVTLFGYSAGGMSCSLHLVSPMSKGLFHKVIIGSGSLLGQIPLANNQLLLARKQAKILGCPHETATKIIECLKGKSAIEIGNSLPQFAEFGNEPVMIWLPVIEKDFGQERFLTDNPVDLIMDGNFEKVPILSGVTADEFAGKAVDLMYNDELLQQLDENWEKNAPITFLYERNTNKSKSISRSLRKFYFVDEKLGNHTLPQLTQIFADGIIGFGVNRGVRLLAQENSESVYYYKFNYKGRYSHYYLPGSNNSVPYGVVHHDDLIYLFYISEMFPEFGKNDPESPTVEKMTTMWANFAKTGKPIPKATDKLDKAKWEPFTKKTQKYMEIGNKLATATKLYDARYAEWEKLFPLPEV